MAEEKQYAPGLYLRARSTQHGEMLSVSIEASKFAEWMRQHQDERGNIRLTIAKRREPGGPKRDLTHNNAWLDTWKPTRQAEQPAREPEKPKLELPEDDVPF
jgi:hypothetical protein